MKFKDIFTHKDYEFWQEKTWAGTIGFSYDMLIG